MHLISAHGLLLHFFGARVKQRAYDLYALLEGCFLVSLGICFLGSGGLLVSGTAGIALITQSVWPLSFGVWFFVVNLPFFYLALKHMGWQFSLRSLLCIICVSLLTDVLNYFLRFEQLPPVLAALIAGGLIGIGLILLFRHRASLGGVNILALYLEQRLGIHSGRVILACDVVVMLLALNFYPLDKVGYSMLSFVVLSSVLGRYHKKAPLTQHESQHESQGEPQSGSSGNTVSARVSAQG